MRTISQMLGMEYEGNFELIERENQNEDGDQQQVTERSTPRTHRIERKELELAYYKSPFVFNSVNKTVQTILSGSPELDSDRKKVIDFFDNFLNQVGLKGGDKTWDELLELIFKHQIIYGEAYVELIHNKQGNRIVDLAIVDPKKMDYAKKSDETIAMDKFGNPIGYVQTLPMNRIASQKQPVVAIPKDINLKNNEIFIPADRIAHFQLYTVGEGFYGIGLIEPSYSATQTQLNLENDYAEKAHSTLFPIRYAQVGDENHEPTPEKVQNILKNLREAVAHTEIAVPYHVNLDMLEASNPRSLRDFLDYFGDISISGLGIPKAYVLGQGGELNRATLDKMNQLFELSLRDVIRRTVRGIERKIFRPIAEMENLQEVPSYRWGAIGVEEMTNKANRLMQYIQAGIFSPDDERIRNMIEKMEEFPAEVK